MRYRFSKFCTSQVIADQTANQIARALEAVIRAIQLLQDHPVPDTFLGRRGWEFITIPDQHDSCHGSAIDC